MDAETKAKLEAIHEDIREIKGDVKAQNGRVRDLEIWRGKVIGGTKVGFKILGTLIALAGVIVAIIKVALQ